MMIEQCKGKDLGKISNRFLDDKTLYHCSIKYDGNYVQIHKKGRKVKFFTSGGKEFYIKNIAEDLICMNEGRDFILECEYIANTTGQLGSRGNCTTTTFRTKFTKGIEVNSDNVFMVFDTIDTVNGATERLAFRDRINLPSNIRRVSHFLMNLEQAKFWAKKVHGRGYEGIYGRAMVHKYRPGKKVNDAIKFKPRPTADLLCTGIEPGDGKYFGQIGSLILEDSQGRIVRVGSGLSDNERSKDHHEYIGKIIEVEYEQVLDTYIQPVFVQVRHDKEVPE